MKTRASVRKVSSLYYIPFSDSFNKNVDPLSEVSLFKQLCYDITVFTLDLSQKAKKELILLFLNES